MDFFLDFCFAAKTCCIKIINGKNDILREIVKKCSSKMINHQSGACKKITFDEQFLTISHKISFLRPTILTRHVFAAKQIPEKNPLYFLSTLLAILQPSSTYQARNLAIFQEPFCLFIYAMNMHCQDKQVKDCLCQKNALIFKSRDHDLRSAVSEFEPTQSEPATIVQKLPIEKLPIVHSADSSGVSKYKTYA